MSCNSVYLDDSVVGKRQEEGTSSSSSLVSFLWLSSLRSSKKDSATTSSSASDVNDFDVTNASSTSSSSTTCTDAAATTTVRSKMSQRSNGIASFNGTFTNTAATTTTTVAVAAAYSNPLLQQLHHELQFLPQDIQMKCFTYLCPKDVIMLSCVNRHFYNLLQYEQSSTMSFSNVLWFQLFLRDYAWVVSTWKYGRDAVNRSRGTTGSTGRFFWKCPTPVAKLLRVEEGEEEPCAKMVEPQLQQLQQQQQTNDDHDKVTIPTMKDFYFIFAQTWLEYCIAGRTENPTLVGLHGHVFDMTSFLHQHPGSSETIVMHGAGKDSTAFFEAVGHSKNARSLAIDNLVQVIDLSCCCRGVLVGRGEGGVNRAGTGLVASVQQQVGIEILPHKRSNKIVFGRPETLVTLRQSLDRERLKQDKMAQSAISTIMANKGEQEVVGHVNVYFDPLCYCWKAWYLNLNFEPVFLHNLNPDGP
jgi:Cytochrome b involved in lipid metabolism